MTRPADLTKQKSSTHPRLDSCQRVDGVDLGFTYSRERGHNGASEQCLLPSARAHGKSVYQLTAPLSQVKGDISI